MNLTLDLNPEQLAAIEARSTDAGKTPEEFLTDTIMSLIASYTDADFSAAANRLVSAAKDLPFEQRMAIIAQVEQAIQTP